MEKGYVAYFVVSVIRDVLGHVTIKLLKGSDVGLTRATDRSDASELVILLPQVGLDDLCGKQQLQNRDVSFCEIPYFPFLAEGRSSG
jgi:hypothetical protein